MSPVEAATLAAAALAAGAMNAVAGGGTILTFPALLAFGMPPLAANATSTFALMAGTAGSTFSYRAHIPAIRAWLPSFGVVSVGGGLLGAWLLTSTPEAFFSQMVPWLLLFATVLFIVQGPLRRWALAANMDFRRSAMTSQFLVAVYGGYFGAGIGILMLAAFGLMGLHRIHEMNALKTLLAAAINLVAAAFFAVAGFVAWPQALLMTVAATGGYFAGAHFAQRIPEDAVRWIVAGIGLVISAVMLVRQFAG